MRLLLALLLASVSAAFSQEFVDPRTSVSNVEEIMVNGIEKKTHGNLWDSILIIHWITAPPDGEDDCYQISGIPGYHSKERVAAFLKAFYSREVFPNRRVAVPNVVICGSNWYGGAELQLIVKEYSKEFQFSVFYAGGAFKTAKLSEEPEPRKAMIKRAFEASKRPATPK